MGDSYGNPQQNSRNFDGRQGVARGGRGSGNREGGGFRIRLSDNEMKASRAIQEAFNLRSTVAVLGFATRTLGQMLEEGKLDDLISQHKSQSGRASDNRGLFRKDGERNNPKNFRNGNKPNPFARPTKPSPQDSEDQKESPLEDISISNNQKGLAEGETSNNSSEALSAAIQDKEERSTKQEGESSNQTNA